MKAAILDSHGTILDTTSVGYHVTSPEPGWAETDPSDWWAALATAMDRFHAGLLDRVRGIGLSGQMHGVVLTHSNGNPHRPAILWSDMRSASCLGEFEQVLKRIAHSSPNPVVAGMAGPTLLWIAKNEPATLRRSQYALQPKDWLRMQLTGVAATDPSDASATLLYDFGRDWWDEELLAALELPMDLFPAIVPSHSVAGVLQEQPARLLGLPPGIPVAVGAADAASAAIGGRLTRPGQAQVVVGTAAQIVLVTKAPTPDSRRRTHVFHGALPSRYYSMAAMQNAGLALEWVRARLGLTWAELYGSLDATRDSHEGDTPIFLPYISGERTPLLDPTARAVWAGLGLNHENLDLARAAILGVAFAVRDGLDALRSAAKLPERLRLAGGGSRDPRFSQLLADVLEVPLEPVDATDASVVGAALLASVAAGLRTLGDLESQEQASQSTIAPRPQSPWLKQQRSRYNSLRTAFWPSQGEP